MRMLVAFEKTERVRHLGHLDLMRFMQRALRRSGLPIRYSQGFNPHVLLSFASPLPVGASGAEELMDVAIEGDVTEEAFAAALGGALPDSLPLVAVRAVDDRHPKLMAALETASYRLTLPPDAPVRQLAEAIGPLLAREEIMAIRKSKSGEKLVDIRPMLHTLSMGQGEDGAACLCFRVSLTELATLKPSLLVETLSTQAGVEPTDGRLRRLRLYAKKDGETVPLLWL